MTQIKRDLLAQGPTSDYARVEPYFASKWQYWILKWKYVVSMSVHSLETNIVRIFSLTQMPKDVQNLLFQYDKFSKTVLRPQQNLKTMFHNSTVSNF